jgi:hypothetical protein
MSGLGSVQNKMTGMSRKGVIGRSLDPVTTLDRALGTNVLPHNTQYDAEQKQKSNADDLANQQAADAAAAAQGPQSMAVRSQLFSSATNDSGGVTASGNEADMAGVPLGAARRPRAARRVLVG